MCADDKGRCLFNGRELIAALGLALALLALVCVGCAAVLILVVRGG